MGEAIAVTSGKGGVGKSSICLNLGVMLAQRGYRVCLLDMDLGLKNLDVLMGLGNRVIYDVRDVMQSHCSLNQALIKDKREDNLYLLPACKNIHIDQFDMEELKHIVTYLTSHFDYVLLDSAAGLESGFWGSVGCVKCAIVVATLDYTSLQDADRTIGCLLKENVDVQLVLNRVNPKYIEKGVSVSIQEALSFLSVNLLGIVYEDEEVIKHGNKGFPAVHDATSLMYDCFGVIADRLEGKKQDLPKYRGKSFIQRIFG